jgi:hypothetical protein
MCCSGKGCVQALSRLLMFGGDVHAGGSAGLDGAPSGGWDVVGSSWFVGWGPVMQIAYVFSHQRRRIARLLCLLTL